MQAGSDEQSFDPWTRLTNAGDDNIRIGSMMFRAASQQTSPASDTKFGLKNAAPTVLRFVRMDTPGTATHPVAALSIEI